MKKVLLFGATGMLGSAVYGVLKDRYELILAIRDQGKVKLLTDTYGTAQNAKVATFDAEILYKEFLEKKGSPSEYLKNFFKTVGEFDYAINALGVTIPFSLKDPALTFFINGALPHVLARELGSKLIHITTDCAFDGKTGFPYNENSPKTPVDIYGLSKSLGEPTECLTIRTSIIGRELAGHTGLLDWFLQQDGKTITGYTNHFWNGITTKEFGNVCDKIMSEPGKYPKSGLYHVFSTTVSKYEMLQVFAKKFNITCEIKKDDEPKLNRVLSTVKDLNTKLEVPSFLEMIEAL